MDEPERECVGMRAIVWAGLLLLAACGNARDAPPRASEQREVRDAAALDTAVTRADTIMARDTARRE